ncbi:uncharacterized protein LOC124477871 [Hypomesus transpacificus]|uniref:uncharacterized protein LOC124477871 n=1 Tax=Hypomesus transpacificus TaxID=137520 RepID=UPI001F083F32|nr:uncharacterized protein LOC124477871 [Hypomesus transpacificus]
MDPAVLNVQETGEGEKLEISETERTEEGENLTLQRAEELERQWPSHDLEEQKNLSSSVTAPVQAPGTPGPEHLQNIRLARHSTTSENTVEPPNTDEPDHNDHQPSDSLIIESPGGNEQAAAIMQTIDESNNQYLQPPDSLIVQNLSDEKLPVLQILGEAAEDPVLSQGKELSPGDLVPVDSILQPGDPVPALGKLRVVIRMKSNDSQVHMEVTSCCLSPSAQLYLPNSTCCMVSRAPVCTRLLPSAVSTSTSFSISLFQLVHYSVTYLHCDLLVCPRNCSDCERNCIQQRDPSSSSLGPEAISTNRRNHISFGPMMKGAQNSTFAQEMEPVDLQLVLVVVGLVVAGSLVTLTLLLVWLAHKQRRQRLVDPETGPRCGCLRTADLL